MFVSVGVEGGQQHGINNDQRERVMYDVDSCANWNQAVSSKEKVKGLTSSSFPCS